MLLDFIAISPSPAPTGLISLSWVETAFGRLLDEHRSAVSEVEQSCASMDLLKAAREFLGERASVTYSVPVILTGGKINSGSKKANSPNHDKGTLWAG